MRTFCPCHEQRLHLRINTRWWRGSGSTVIAHRFAPGTPQPRIDRRCIGSTLRRRLGSSLWRGGGGEQQGARAYEQLRSWQGRAAASCCAARRPPTGAQLPFTSVRHQRSLQALGTHLGKSQQQCTGLVFGLTWLGLLGLLWYSWGLLGCRGLRHRACHCTCRWRRHGSGAGLWVGNAACLDESITAAWRHGKGDVLQGACHWCSTSARLV